MRAPESVFGVQFVYLGILVPGLVSARTRLSLESRALELLLQAVFDSRTTPRSRGVDARETARNVPNSCHLVILMSTCFDQFFARVRSGYGICNKQGSNHARKSQISVSFTSFQPPLPLVVNESCREACESRSRVKWLEPRFRNATLGNPHSDPTLNPPQHVLRDHHVEDLDIRVVPMVPEAYIL